MLIQRLLCGGHSELPVDMEFMLGGSGNKGVVLAAGTAEQASSKKGGLKISLEQREQDG